MVIIRIFSSFQLRCLFLAQLPSLALFGQIPAKYGPGHIIFHFYCIFRLIPATGWGRWVEGVPRGKFPYLASDPRMVAPCQGTLLVLTILQGVLYLGQKMQNTAKTGHFWKFHLTQILWSMHFLDPFFEGNPNLNSEFEYLARGTHYKQVIDNRPGIWIAAPASQDNMGTHSISFVSRVSLLH